MTKSQLLPSGYQVISQKGWIEQFCVYYTVNVCLQVYVLWKQSSDLHSFLPYRMLPKNCQMLLFSATFEESVWNFAQRIVPDPNIIKLKREEETLDTIKQYYVLCNNKEEKFQALCNLYGAITIAQAMIFCHVSLSLCCCCYGVNLISCETSEKVILMFWEAKLYFISVLQTRKTAGWLAGELSREGHQVALLSGEMQVEQRAAVIERFRDGKEKVLVTTNVCARGEDN